MKLFGTIALVFGLSLVSPIAAAQPAAHDEDASELRDANARKVVLVARELDWIGREEEIASGLYIGGFLGLLAGLGLAVGSFAELDGRPSAAAQSTGADLWLAAGVCGVAITISSIGAIVSGALLDLDAGGRRRRMPVVRPTVDFGSDRVSLGLTATF